MGELTELPIKTREEITIIKHLVLAIFIIMMSVSLTITNSINVKAADLLNHTITFSNKTVVKTLFYPYRNPAGVLDPYQARSLQGIAVDDSNNMYITYATGDKTTFGYIYKYSSQGKLIKMSSMLTTGHAQGIAYKNGYLYLLVNITGQTYKLQKVNPTTLTVLKTWDLPSIVHPNVITLLDSTTAVGVSKSVDGKGYNIYKIKLGADSTTTINWKEKIYIDGLVGTSSSKPIQGFTYGNGKYYILSDGEYMSFDSNGKNVNRVKLNTTREPEGMAIDKSGKILIQFNYYNEVFKQQ